MCDYPQTPRRVFGGFCFPSIIIYIVLFGIILNRFPTPPAGAATNSVAGESSAAYYLQRGFGDLDANALKSWVDSINLNTAADVSAVIFDEPVSGSLYPPDMASPSFLWSSGQPEPKAWLLQFATKSGDFYVMLDRPWWAPLKRQWDHLKELAGFEPVHLDLYGIGGWSLRRVVAKGQTAFSISTDPVAAKLVFIRKPLPFLRAKENPHLSQMLIGDAGSYDPPRIVLNNQRICFNCHGFSSGQNVFGIDMDVGGDKGGYILKPMRPGTNWVLDADIISWNDLPAPPPAKTNMGLFARPSPDGRYVAATVGETSVFVMIDDLYFSQLFFPATGQIACCDRKTREMFFVPGADLPGYVQTGPEWSPDGKFLYFSRARTRDDLLEAICSGQLQKESDQQRIDALNKKYSIQFNIYRVPFNGGRGGIAQPLTGASHNGASNYFPRVSPDGRWIVFTQSPTGMVLQPDSRLCIVPAGGGKVRTLGCETSVMNSWHSWSANGKWLAFASKVQSPFTEIFLTHIDVGGNASPAIRLFRLSSPCAAAMVPEFVAPDKPLFESLQVKSARQDAITPAPVNIK